MDKAIRMVQNSDLNGDIRIDARNLSVALITLRDITAAFGGPPLLEGVNLQLEEGDRLCLMGRNGCGKSTLLRILCGETAADGGEIMRRQGLRVSLLSQDIPSGLNGSVFDIIADGMGEASRLLEEYHRIGQKLAVEGGDELVRRLEKVQKELEDCGGWGLHLEVERVIGRLGLDGDGDFSSLSGGTKRRVLLARALVAKPDILLLDEPTNHLDMDTIVWLEDFLLREIKTILFVTHDRAFARRLANRVAELDRGRLYAFPCGYDDFIRRREELLEAEVARQALFDKRLAEEEAWIRQGIKARRTRNEGRVRALKRMREERRSRRERLGTAKLRLQEADRSGSLVVDAEEVTFSYDGRTVIKGLSTTVMRGDRVGIIGANGSGKTTLLRLLLGDLVPQQGEVRLGTRREVLYFDQLRNQLDPQKSVQENVADGNDTLVIDGRPRHVIGYLHDFLFTSERARSPVAILSGGERNRLLMAKLFASPSNVLVLDEPTNDLDAETLELLEDLISGYSGTLLLVSHDRDFLNSVVTSILSIGDDGVVSEYVGGYDDWLRQTATVPTQTPSSETQQERQRPAQEKERPRRLSFKEERELESLPGRIIELEEEQQSLHSTLADPDFYRNAGSEVAALNERLATVEAELEVAFRRWEELEGIKEKR